MKTLPIEGDLKNQVLEALPKTPLFRALTPSQSEHVVAAAEMIQFAPEEYLARQAEPSDSFFLLLRGTAAVLVSQAGQSIEIGRLSPPETLGEIGLLLGQPRTATVQAIDPVVALKFEATAFQQMYEKVPNFGLAISRGLANRLRLLSARVPIPAYDSNVQPSVAVLEMLPMSFAQRHRVLPLKVDGNVLTLGSVDDPSSQIVTGVQQLLPGMEVRMVRIESEFYNRVMSAHGGVATWSSGDATAAQPVVATVGPTLTRLDNMVDRMVAEGASDLHLSAGHKPRWRVDGEMREIADAPVLSSNDVYELLDPILETRHRAEFEAHLDCDFGYTSAANGRLRINMFRDARGVSAAMRLISAKLMTFEQLGLPKELTRLCDQPKGLVLVTGPTGSGKSTTLAAMIDYINASRAVHILTLEDPIEFVHPSQKALVQQREVGSHTVGFHRALRASLREDPNIILVGEMRDLETIALVLEAANTGHLVFATLHTASAITTVDRMVDMFPAEQQNQVRNTLGEVLRGVVSQTLCRRTGGGRIAAIEILMVNHAVSNLIHEGKTNQIPNIMQTSKADGNFILNEELARLVKKRQIDKQEALDKALDKKDLERRLAPPPPAPGSPEAAAARH